MATISLRKVCKRFERTTVIEDLDLDIDDREFVVLLGPSGCGKSTLLRMIAGLEEPSAGDLLMDGRVVNHVPARQRDVAMVFQNYALYPHMTVAENMGLALRLRKQPASAIQRAVHQAAEILAITHLLERKPRQLSGGQRQRVAMGRAIVRNPRAFLFDEPLSNLDAELRLRMRTEIKQLHGRLGATMIYVTHDQIEAMTLADRIVIMRDGAIQQIGTPYQVFSQPANLFVAGFIGSPPMNLLPATLAGERLVIPGWGSSLAFASERFQRSPGALTLGVRPDHLLPVAAAGEHALTLPGEVQVVEPLGADMLVFVRPAGSEPRQSQRQSQSPAMVSYKCPYSECLRPGQPVLLGCDLAHLHLFDQQSERSLLLPGG